MSKAQPKALIVGAGEGLSASLARLFAAANYAVVLAARDTAKLADVGAATGAVTFACDATSAEAVDRLFDAHGDAEIVIYNAAFRVRGPLIELVPAEVQKTLQVSAFGGFLVGQQAARHMLARQGGARGTILFTGASASVKGYAHSAPFAMGKFALRGLAQSMARELHPQGIHVAHIVIDGGIRSKRRTDEGHDALLDPDAIAETYMHLVSQPRSGWSWEVEIRPWVETF